MAIKLSDRRSSKATILQSLRIHGPISRIALTKLTGLSRAAISVCIAELIESGLVRETQTREYSGGRPATSLELVSRSRAIIGADLNNGAWTLGAFDLVGNTLLTVGVPVPNASPEAAADELAAALPEFIRQLDIPVVPLLGVCTPGLVDTDRSVIHNLPLFGWQDVDIGAMMKRKIDWPAVFVNRDRARGLLECRHSMERNYTTMIYIGIGSGVAAGLFYKGELMTGAHGGAGEVGHLTIEPDGPLCPCGNRGCLQLYCTEQAIEREVRGALRAGGASSSIYLPGDHIELLKARDICRAADDGDKLAADAVRKAASYLGIAMGNIVNLFNPDVVILGGPLPSASQLFVNTAAKVMKQRAMGPMGSRTIVRPAVYDEQIGGPLGAANFALDRHMSYSLFD